MSRGGGTGEVVPIVPLAQGPAFAKADSVYVYEHVFDSACIFFRSVIQAFDITELLVLAQKYGNNKNECDDTLLCTDAYGLNDIHSTILINYSRVYHPCILMPRFPLSRFQSPHAYDRVCECE